MIQEETQIRTITIETKAQNKGHYVPGVISNGTLYISGQLPMHHETGIMDTSDIISQTNTALENVEKVAAAAGLTKDDIVMCRVYIPDMEYWDTVNEVYARFFGNHKPARVMVPSRNLHNGVLVEIEAIAEVR